MGIRIYRRYNEINFGSTRWLSAVLWHLSHDGTKPEPCFPFIVVILKSYICKLKN